MPHIKKSSYLSSQSQPPGLELHNCKALKAPEPRQALGDAFIAADGSISQIWVDNKYGLLASTLETNGALRVAAGQQVRNALDPSDCGDALLGKLMAAEPCSWAVAFSAASKSEAYIWPRMSAAGSTDHYAYAPRKFNPVAGNDNDVKRAERYLESKGFERRTRDGGGGSAWFQKSSGRLAQVFPENSAVPARVVVTLRGSGVEVPLHDDRRNRRPHVRQATREAAREHNREWDKHRYDQPSGRRYAENERVDLGHRPGAEFRNAASFYAYMGSSRQEMSAAQNRAMFFQEELPASNQGHGWELPTAQYIAGGTPLLMQDGRPMVAIMYQLNPTDARWALVAAYRDYMYSSASAGSFEQYLQMAGLVGSYNRLNPGRPVPDPGAGFRPVGGVELNVGEITELRAALQGIDEAEHVFCIPAADGRPPFSNEELQQLLRELATGIFVHDTRPMFSLHFNQDGELYPVIPPEYANTLVGHVMGMLDYMMKGYLNGGMFPETFVREWLSKGQPDTAPHVGRLVDLRQEYAVIPETLPYRGLRQVMRAHGVAEGQDSRGLTSSFRIIADNPVVCAGNSFLIGESFRVEYTIEGTPEFNEYRRQHIALHGCEPPEYRQLDDAYREMAREIRFNMPKLPACRDMFKMLGVIQFFTQYFLTLKATQKTPYLPAMVTPNPTAFPKALPPLPILDGQNEPQELLVTFTHLWGRLTAGEKRAVEKEFLQGIRGGSDAVALTTDQEQALVRALIEQVRDSIAVEGALADAGLPKDFYASGVRLLLQSVSATYKTHDTAVRTVLGRLRAELNAVARHEKEERACVDKGVQDDDRTLRRSLQEARVDLDRQKRVALQQVETEIARALREVPRGANHAQATEAANSWRRERQAAIEAGIADALNALKSREADVRRELAAAQGVNRTRLRGLQSERRTDCEARIKKLEAEAHRLKCPMNMPELSDTAGVRVHAPVTVLHTGSVRREMSGVRTRVVGGCILDLAEKAPRYFSAEDILQAGSFDLSVNACEQFTSVQHNGSNYYVFKLAVLDQTSLHGGDYSWMRSLLIHDADLLWDDAAWTVISAIVAGNVAGMSAALDASPNIQALLRRGDVSGMTPIHYAAARGGAEIIRTLVDKGADINRCSFTDVTPLHIAAAAGHVEAVTALCLAGAYKDATTPHGATALHLAVEAKRMEVVQALIGHRASVNTCMGNGMQPLHTAVVRGDPALVEALLSAGADREAEMAEQVRPLHLAASFGHEQVVRILLQKGAKRAARQRNGMTPLHLAASAGHVASCGALLMRLSLDEINQTLASRQTALHLAAVRGHTKTVAALLRAGADASRLDGNSEDALMAATRSGHVAAALLLAKRAQVSVRNTRGESAAVLAAKYGFWEIVDALLARRAALHFSTRDHGWNVAHCLCRHGDDRRLAMYFDRGFISTHELSVLDKRGLSPACLAAQHGHDGVVALFAARGWNAAWPAGKALDKVQWAAFGGCMELLRTHVSQGGELQHVITDDASPHYSKSLAYLAAEGGHATAVKLLLRAGARLHYDFDGETKSVALAAVRSGNLAAAAAAVQHQDDIHAPLERAGLTLIRAAVRQGDVDMVKLLKSYGARFEGQSESLSDWPLHEAVRGDFEALIELFTTTDLKLPPNIVPFAVRRGSESALRAILKRAPDVNVRDSAGETGVMLAVRHQKLQHLHLLLAEGGDVSASNDAHSPLTLAAANGNLSALQVLVNAQACIDEAVAGRTALHWACEKGHLEVVEYLLARGADANVLSSDDQTCHALARNHVEIQILLAPGTGELQARKQALKRALGVGDVNAIRDAIQKLPLHARICLEPGSDPVPVAHALVATRDDDITRLLTPRSMEAYDATGRTTLHVAAQIGYDEILTALGAAEFDVEQLDDHGESPLFHAVRGCHGKFVKRLLKLRHQRTAAAPGEAKLPAKDVKPLRIDPNRRNNQEVTVAHIAALKGNHDILRAVLTAGCDADSKDCSGMTPLAYAICSTSRDCVVDLLDAGANVHMVVGRDRESYLQVAARHGALEIFLELLARGASVNHCDAEGRYLVHTTALFADGGLLNVLFGAYPEETNRVDRGGEKPIHYAARNPKISALRALLDADADPNDASAGASPNRGSFPPAHWAAVYNNVAALNMLFEGGADLAAEVQGATALNSATPSAARTLARRYPGLLDAPSERAEVLVKAARSGDVEAVRDIIEAGALPNGAAQGGTTAAMAAAEAGHADVLAALLARGANAMSASSSDDLPIFLAARRGHVACVRLLLEVVESAALIDTEGKTLVHLAVEAGHSALTAALVSQMGQNIEARDNSGRSPLARALELRAHSLAKLLVILGADIDAVLGQGDPPVAQSLRDWHGAPGDTPVARAARLGEAALLDTLLNVHDPEARNEAGERALQVCSDATCTRLLLEGGAPVTSELDAHETPLLRAVQQRSLAQVRVLLGYGAPIAAPAKSPTNPLYEAFRTESPVTFKVLLSHCPTDPAIARSLLKAVSKGDFVAATQAVALGGLPVKTNTAAIGKLFEAGQGTETQAFLTHWLDLSKTQRSATNRSLRSRISEALYGS